MTKRDLRDEFFMRLFMPVAAEVRGDKGDIVFRKMSCLARC